MLAAPLSTVGRVLKAIGLGRLKNLQPAEPVRRYQWARPGDMIHVDTKQLARFERVGHWITGDRRLGCSRGAWYEKAHVAIDDATRLAYVEVCRMRSRQPRWGFCCGPWLGSMVRGSAARGCSPITAAPTAPGLGEKPPQHFGSHQNEPGRTRHEPMARPRDSSKPYWRSGRIRWPFRPQLNGTTGCRAIWRSITVAGATWPWVAAPPLSSSDCCGLLNDLVRKHS